MSRKNKQQKSMEAWKRVYEGLMKHHDLERFQHSYEVTRHIHGECSGYLWFKMRHDVFHNIIIPQWMSSTNIVHRNTLYNLVLQTLGWGLANELQLISNKRTW